MKKIFIQNITQLIDENSNDVLDEIYDEIEKYEHLLDSSIVKEILIIFEKYPTFDFGLPGSLTHFIEKFYNNGYEEELIDSLRQNPTSQTLWLLQRLINGTQKTEQRRVYVNEFNKIYRDTELNKELESIVLEHIEYNDKKEKSLLMNSVIELYENKKDYDKVLIGALSYFSANTGCAEDLEATEEVLERWYDLGIINQKMYKECIEKSAVNRWL